MGIAEFILGMRPPIGEPIDVMTYVGVIASMHNLSQVSITSPGIISPRPHKAFGRELRQDLMDRVANMGQSDMSGAYYVKTLARGPPLHYVHTLEFATFDLSVITYSWT